MRVTRYLVWRPPPVPAPVAADCRLELASLRQLLRWAREDAGAGRTARAAWWLREAERSIRCLERALNVGRGQEDGSAT